MPDGITSLKFVDIKLHLVTVSYANVNVVKKKKGHVNWVASCTVWKLSCGLSAHQVLLKRGHCNHMLSLNDNDQS